MYCANFDDPMIYLHINPKDSKMSHIYLVTRCTLESICLQYTFKAPIGLLNLFYKITSFIKVRTNDRIIFNYPHHLAWTRTFTIAYNNKYTLIFYPWFSNPTLLLFIVVAVYLFVLFLLLYYSKYVIVCCKLLNFCFLMFLSFFNIRRTCCSCWTHHISALINIRLGSNAALQSEKLLTVVSWVSINNHLHCFQWIWTPFFLHFTEIVISVSNIYIYIHVREIRL